MSALFRCMAWDIDLKFPTKVAFDSEIETCLFSGMAGVQIVRDLDAGLTQRVGDMGLLQQHQIGIKDHERSHHGKQHPHRARQRCQASADGGRDARQAGDAGEGLDRADAHSGGGGDEEWQIQPVALIVVLRLEHAEGTVVVWVLVNVERDEGEDAGHGDDKGDG